MSIETVADALQALLEQAGLHVRHMKNLQTPAAIGADAFVRSRLSERLGEWLQAHGELDFEHPGAVFADSFARACRCRELVTQAAAPLNTVAERTASQLRQLSIDLALDLAALGTLGGDASRLLDELGRALSNAGPSHGADARDASRVLFSRATDLANRARVLQEIIAAGRELRVTANQLLDSQKALDTAVGEIAQAWPHWHALVSHFAASLTERAATARYHPDAPDASKRLGAAIERAARASVSLERQSEATKGELQLLRRKAQMA